MAVRAPIKSLMRRKTLLIIPSWHTGGAETYALRLVKFAGPGSFEWHVMSKGVDAPELRDDFCAAGAHVHDLGLGYANAVQMRKFLKFLDEGRFDTVCTLNGIFGGLSLWLAKKAGVRCRVAWHRRSTPAYRPSAGRALYASASRRLLERSATMILSNSRAALDRFHGPAWMDSGLYRVIPNGVDVRDFEPTPDSRSAARSSLGFRAGEFVIGHVGRVDPAKNHQTIFRVARNIVGIAPNARFLFCGRGTDTPSFRQELDDHGIGEHCVALGVRRDIPSILHGLDAFYFPSVTEGQPNALIEAMLAKVPFVASDIPAIREAVPPASFKDLVSPMDEEAAASALLGIGRGATRHTDDVFAWAKDRFDPSRNFSEALGVLAGRGETPRCA